MRCDLQLIPKRAGTVLVALQHRSRNGRWLTGQAASFGTASTGVKALGLSRGSRKVTYRFAAVAKAGAVAGGSPTVVTPLFLVEWRPRARPGWSAPGG